MRSEQPSFTDVEYQNRRRVSRREQFLEAMDATIPWARWVELIEPFYYNGKKGRKPKPLATMLRMYLLQAWFSSSDEGVEDAVYDSYAMRKFMGLDFAVEQVPDATTLLHFRHLLEKHELGEKLLGSQNEIFEQQGWIMRGGSIVDATIIAAPSSTKNATGTRDPEMHQTKKGNQWHFGMKAHIGTDAGTGYVHSVTATSANVHDLDQVANLVRDDDEVVYADAGYQAWRSGPTSPVTNTARRLSSGSQPARGNWPPWWSRTVRSSRVRRVCARRSSIRSWSSNGTSGSPRPATGGWPRTSITCRFCSLQRTG
jgi:IS5 family transposase